MIQHTCKHVWEEKLDDTFEWLSTNGEGWYNEQAECVTVNDEI